mgnify:CR=1 FL=1
MPGEQLNEQQDDLQGSGDQQVIDSYPQHTQQHDQHKPQGAGTGQQLGTGLLGGQYTQQVRWLVQPANGDAAVTVQVKPSCLGS